MFKKIVAFFMLLALAARPSIAQNQDESFTAVSGGEITPFSGFLFTPDGLARIYTTVEEERKRREIQYNAQLGKLTIEIDRVNSLMRTEIGSRDRLILDITTQKNETIADLSGQLSLTPWYTAGAFLAGILLTGTVFYFAVGAVK